MPLHRSCGIAGIRGTDPATTLIELLKADAEAGSRSPMLGFAMSEPDIEALMAWPQTVIGSVEMSLPAAVYGVLMFFIALAFGFLIRGRGRAAVADVAADADPATVPAAATASRDTGEPDR